MARIWFEDYDWTKHRNPMGSEVGTPAGIEHHVRAPSIERHLVTFVRVEGFTFEFHSAEQIQACLEFYSQKTLPSSRVDMSQKAEANSWAHWESQRWFDRLPGGLRRESKRTRIVQALEEATHKVAELGKSATTTTR